MTIAFSQQPVTDALKAFIAEGFARHALQLTGIDGCRDKPVGFVAEEDGKVMGAVVAQLFWGQLNIKNVIVSEEARGQGLAARLIEQAHDYGHLHGCDFAFVETMSFQARGFYEKLGYKVEFIRDGFASGSSFIYMKKELHKDKEGNDNA